MTNEKITKAEMLRIKQATETLKNLLTIELVDFKERFLNSFVDYKFNEFTMQILRIQKRIDEKLSKTTSETDSYIKGLEYQKSLIEKQRSLKATNTLKFINEAAENFNTKFNRLVDELVKHGVRSYPLTIEAISSGSTENDFNFLITHKTTIKTVQVYARIIFAEGLINAPHYRFIITANKNLIH